MAAVFYDNFNKLGEEGYMLLSILGFLFCFCSCIEVLYFYLLFLLSLRNDFRVK